MQAFQNQTAEQLMALVQHIASLQEKVQVEVYRKEDERTQWEKSQRSKEAISAEHETPVKSHLDEALLEGRNPAFTFANQRAD